MRIAELTQDSWPALERLFGPNGAQSGCWCTWFLRTAADLRGRTSAENREFLHSRVCSGEPTGLLAFDGDDPVGWVAVAPRLDYARLALSKIAAPVSPTEDLAEVWAVTCFFIHRTARRRGLAASLLAAAVEHARDQGAHLIEGYPVDTAGEKRGSGDLFHGTLSLFLDAGFELVERRGPRRALVRKTLRPAAR